MATGKPYLIVEDQRVSEVIAAEIGKDQRVEDIFEALKWRIAREPDCGDRVEHDGVLYRLVILAPLKDAKNPTILARYVVDDEAGRIDVLFVKVYPFDPAAAYTPREFGRIR